MTNYTIGILFRDENFTEVAMIKKERPKWQKHLFNFPGGHVEGDETAVACVSREFNEETSLNIKPQEWEYIGRIKGKDYGVCIFTALYNPDEHGTLQTMTDEEVHWINTSMHFNALSNVRWLIPFAVNFHQQGNKDELEFGLFTYK